MLKNSIKKQTGFSLIELLITLAITGIVCIAIFSVYKTTNKTYAVQNEVVEAQNNLRAAMSMLTLELKSAGYDPGNDDGSVAPGGAGAGIGAANAENIYFARDINDDDDYDGDSDTEEADGVLDDTDEHFLFCFYDSDSDGSKDTLGYLKGDSVGDVNPATNSPIPFAENIENIEFYYTLADGTQTSTPGTPANIRSVKISILARTAHVDPGFTDNSDDYIPASEEEDSTPTSWTCPDGYHCVFSKVFVRFRNMGI